MKDDNIKDSLPAVVFFILITIAIPHMAIWALNVLFSLGLAHSLTNWLAAFCLIGILESIFGGSDD